MGEIADMMLDGTLCEGCGVALDGEAGGFPRRCADCRRETPSAPAPTTPGKVQCRYCDRWLSPAGVGQHVHDKHPREHRRAERIARADERRLAEKTAHVKAAKQTRDHCCHWPGCTKRVKPAFWGCFEHWHMLPKRIRNKIWNTYRPGQEEDGDPSREYILAAEDAQEWILKHHPQTTAQGALPGVPPV